MSVDTLIEQATVAKIMAITCPIQRAAHISRLARANGTLPPALSATRRADIRVALTTWTGRIADLAAEVGISRSRVFQLAKETP